MGQKVSIAVAEGDGIGPEIMQATLHILSSAGALLDIHKVEIGEKIYLKGNPFGIDQESADILLNAKAFLKAPIVIPPNRSVQSFKTQIQALFGLYADIHLSTSYFPIIDSAHPEMDIWIARECQGDSYTEIEYQQTPDVCTSQNIFCLSNTEKMMRYTFAAARRQGRKKISCFENASKTKSSDAFFRNIFGQVALEHSNILNEYYPLDSGIAKIANAPELFDVIIIPNFFDDFLSNIASEISGIKEFSVSLQIGDRGAMFAPVHGPIPEIAGQNKANPSGLLLASIQMLSHIGQTDVASLVHNAWLKTLEDGIHTSDIYREGKSQKKVSTREFSDAVIRNLGKNPVQLKTAVHKPDMIDTYRATSTEGAVKRHLVGVDVFIYCPGRVESFFAKISHINIGPLRMHMIMNQGVEVWPQRSKEISCIEQWCCRFLSDQGKTVSQNDVIQILHAFDHMQVEIIRSEFLFY